MTLIERFMSEDKNERIVAHVFETDAEEVTDETTGTATLVTRDNPADVWGPPRVLGENVPFAAWKLKMKIDGFTHA